MLALLSVCMLVLFWYEYRLYTRFKELENSVSTYSDSVHRFDIHWNQCFKVSNQLCTCTFIKCDKKKFEN